MFITEYESNHSNVVEIVSSLKSSSFSAQAKIECAEAVIRKFGEFCKKKQKMSKFIHQELKKIKIENTESPKNQLLLQRMFCLVSDNVRILEEIDVNSSNTYLCRKQTNNKNTEYIYLNAGITLLMINKCFLPITDNKVEISVILGQTNLDYFLSYLQLCVRTNKLIKLITSQGVWEQLKQIIEIVWGRDSLKLFQNCEKGGMQNMCTILKDQIMYSFNFEVSSVGMKKNQWAMEAYDILIIINGTKYLIESIGVKDQEIVQNCWRKNIISESQYCQYIDNSLFSIHTAHWHTSKLSQAFIEIKEVLLHRSTSYERYQNMVRCDLFMLMPEELISEIYRCGQITSYKKNQVVYKNGMKLTKFYVILQGQCLCGNQKLPQTYCFHRKSITTEEKQKGFESVTSNCDQTYIFSIQIITLKYILTHFLQQLHQIEKQQKHHIQNFQTTEWLSKLITYCSHTGRTVNKQNLCKRLFEQKVELENEIWRNLCYRDIRFLIESGLHENEKEDEVK